MNKKEVCLSLVVFSLLIVSFSSASFVVDQNKTNLIKTVYNTGDYVSAVIGISFNNESTESELKTNVGGSIYLKDWLKKANKLPNRDYNCSLNNCETAYTSDGVASNVNPTISNPKVLGFYISGDKINIKSLSFKADTSLDNTCSKPYSIDVFEKQMYFFEDYSTNGLECGSAKYGCFDKELDNSQYQFANLTTSEYCEKISLSPAPAYKLGGRISGPLGPVKEKLHMNLYNSDFTILFGGCDLPFSGEQSECNLNYPISKEAEYHVCISSNVTSSAYQIRTESRDNLCGIPKNSFGSTSTIDFELYAKPLQYSGSSATFDSDKFALLNYEANLTKIANEYLSEKYNSTCLGNGCYLPLKIVGGSQQISISDASVVYESNGILKTDSQIYNLKKDSGSVSSETILVSIDSLQIPINTQVKTLHITLDGKTLIKENINVLNPEVNIYPNFALIGVPTEFYLESNLSLSSATWKFSDNPTNLQNGLEVVHTFSSEGSYTVDVDVTLSDGSKITRTKSVLVGEPKASAEELLDITIESIGTLTKQINSMQGWIRDALNSKFELVQKNTTLAQIESKLNAANTNEEYIGVINEISALNIPLEVGLTSTGKFPLLSGYNNLNLDYARTLNGVDYPDDQLNSALSEWLRENYNTEVELEVISGSYSSGVNPILTKFKIITNPSNPSSQEQRYLIINVPFEQVTFLTGYSQKELSGATYLPINNDQQTIEFYVEGELKTSDLGAYILPAVSELEQGGYSFEVVESNANRIKKVLIYSFVIIIFLAIGATLGLQYWYRTRYEKHLFPREEELFNVMTFVYNSQKAGLKEGDIRKKLISSGWSREQTNYALGKLNGKILGLFGLPIYSGNVEKKVKNEIQRRQEVKNSRKVY